MGPAIILVLATMLASAPAAKDAHKGASPAWLGEELPLPLMVRTPEDLHFKSAAERQYLIFNLFAGGKVAWDAGEWESAATKWEALLRVSELPAEIEAAVKPFAAEARRRAGGASAEPIAVQQPAPRVAEPEPSKAPSAAAASGTVTGTISGGGALGPGGTVVFLKRAAGATPRPKPARGKVIVQRGKAFWPRVLAVPQGTEIEFRNEDEISHNVFSLSKASEFDLGLYRGGLAKTQRFDTAGPVQLLCNIHTSMVGYVYVVDTPWFAQADSTGAFVIKGVPRGDYVLEAWHESAASPSKQMLHVEGDAQIALTVGGDKAQPAFVPDKYGKPRQVQLGY